MPSGRQRRRFWRAICRNLTGKAADDLEVVTPKDTQRMWRGMKRMRDVMAGGMKVLEPSDSESESGSEVGQREQRVRASNAIQSLKMCQRQQRLL